MLFSMGYDETLASRIRRLVARRSGIAEKRMFGGLTFTRGGKMFAAVVGQEVLVRVGADEGAALAAVQGVRPMLHGGRPAAGYVYVAAERVVREGDLRAWIDRGLAEAARAAGGRSR